MLYSYAFWCSPCVKKLPSVVQFCEENNIGLYVLLIHYQDSKEMNTENKAFKDNNLNVLVLSDIYGKTPRKKHKQFLAKYYLDEKIMDDLSKIIFYSSGELKYVSNWMDGDNILELKIKPLILK